LAPSFRSVDAEADTVTGTNEQTIGRPLRFCLCVALCAFVGWTGGIITAPQIPVWYASLAKPAWTPPNSVFPVAWSALYFLMAVTLWRLWDRVSPSSARPKAIVWFFIQLALNFVWTPVFFGWHAVHTGLAIIVLLDASLCVTIWLGAKADRLVVLLLIPYLLWLCYATALNLAIALMNP
jgi:translocator protein